MKFRPSSEALRTTISLGKSPKNAITPTSSRRPSDAHHYEPWECGCISHLVLSQDSQPTLRIPKIIHLASPCTLVGRADTCHAVIDSDAAPFLISRRHACITHVPPNACPLHFRGQNQLTIEEAEGYKRQSTRPIEENESVNSDSRALLKRSNSRKNSSKQISLALDGRRVSRVYPNDDADTALSDGGDLLARQAVCTCGTGTSTGNKLTPTASSTAPSGTTSSSSTARCCQCGGGWVVGDGNGRGVRSTNGVCVNRVRIQQPVWLCQGDVVTFGKMIQPPEFSYRFDLSTSTAHLPYSCSVLRCVPLSSSLLTDSIDNKTKRKRAAGEVVNDSPSGKKRKSVDSEEGEGEESEAKGRSARERRGEVRLSEVGRDQMGIVSGGMFFPIDAKSSSEDIAKLRSLSSVLQSKLQTAQQQGRVWPTPDLPALTSTGTSPSPITTDTEGRDDAEGRKDRESTETETEAQRERRAEDDSSSQRGEAIECDGGDDSLCDESEGGDLSNDNNENNNNNIIIIIIIIMLL